MEICYLLDVEISEILSVIKRHFGKLMDDQWGEKR